MLTNRKAVLFRTPTAVYPAVRSVEPFSSASAAIAALRTKPRDQAWEVWDAAGEHCLAWIDNEGKVCRAIRSGGFRRER